MSKWATNIVKASGILVFCVGCGVKGRPLPPFTPALLGRGEPSFSKATEKVKIQKRTHQKIDGDFEDSEDFDPPEEKK